MNKIYPDTKCRGSGRAGQAMFIRIAVAALLCLICAFLSAKSVQAAPTYYDSSDRASIEDKADVLTDSEENELLSQAGSLSDETDFEIRVVTIDDAQGKETGEYAEDYFESLSTTFEGGCYILDLDNREYYVATYGDLQYYLTDDRIDSLLDDAYDYASSGDWEGLLASMLSDTKDFYEDGIEDGTAIYDEDTDTYTVYQAPKRITAAEGAASAVIGIIAFLILFVSTRMRYGMKIPETNDYSAKDNVRLRLDKNQDILIDRHVSSRRIPRDPPGGGHGGGGGGHISSVHHTSGGHSAGGGGRHF